MAANGGPAGWESSEPGAASLPVGLPSEGAVKSKQEAAAVDEDDEEMKRDDEGVMAKRPDLNELVCRSEQNWH
jgi:hypothetical protein